MGTPEQGIQQPRSIDPALLAQLQQLDALELELDLRERAFYSQDVYAHGVLCDAVLRPLSIRALQHAVTHCAAAGVAMSARGGGLSYTDGYIPSQTQSVIFDLSRLDDIEEINELDRYVIVQAGCTWAKLHEALAARGLRTPYWGPLSGLRATVGGALSQGSIFLGSARYGSVGDSVLALEIVTGQGELLRTGSWAADQNTAPFMRYFGPDMTGLFVGDAGSLGFKARASLRLLPAHAHQGFLSFEAARFDALAQAMSAVTRAGLPSECFGFDPVLANMRMQRASLMADVKTLGHVIKSQGLFGGLKIATSGRRFLDVSKFSMHLCLEADSAPELAARMDAARALCAPHVQEIENAIPTVLRSQPFTPPNNMLGPKGERWVPVHGIVPHSRASETFAAVEALFQSQRAALDALQIQHGYLVTTIAASGFLIEPVFYWQDAQSEYHQRMVEPDYLSRVQNFPENLPARAKVDALKHQVAELLRAHGATHFQLGKFYTYRAERNSAQLALLDAIRVQLDPQGLVNPGALA
jgi:FAD/FMN-containing dehydrogenase